MFELTTARLRLIPLPPDLLSRLAGDRPGVEAALGLNSSDVQVPVAIRDDYAQALRLWEASAEAGTTDFRWITNWEIVLKTAQRTIGGIGFAGPPNEEGRVYLAYWLDPRHQKRGYMTETVAALTRWSFETPGVRSVGASTPANNLASQKVLTKNGFTRDGEYDGHPLFARGRAPSG